MIQSDTAGATYINSSLTYCCPKKWLSVGGLPDHINMRLSPNLVKNQCTWQLPPNVNGPSDQEGQ